MMKNYTKEDIIKLVEEEDVEFIRLQFTDMFGNEKCANKRPVGKSMDNQCMLTVLIEACCD